MSKNSGENMEEYKAYMEGLTAEEKLDLNENQLRILYAKYLKRDELGAVIETPRAMFRRIAKEIAGPDHLYHDEVYVNKLEEAFFTMMVNLHFLPGGRTIANAGTPVRNLANCFVIPVHDSMEGIFEAVKEAALIQKRGGGVGYCFSTLRPKGSWVKGCSGIASGPLSFMRVFNIMCSTIMQGNRRGAQMATFHVSHPDIEEFISAKDDLTQLTNFNISVMLDDKFMRAVEDEGEYELIDPHTKQTVRKVRAKEIYDKIAYHAWKTGEPGVLFLDTANKSNTVSHLGQFRATNPCAEIWLLDYEVCNLGSINLDRMVKRGDVDWNTLKKTTRLAIHFLDNVIDAGAYPTTEIDRMAKKTRRIGLGVMGFADLLYQLGIPYSSQRARDLARKIMSTIENTGWEKSQELAEEKGVFPGWKGSTFHEEGKKVRNCAITAIAPTGTLSMLADTSGGCEPNFALAYIKNSHSIGETFTYVNKHFKKIAKEKGFYSEKLMQKLAEQGTLDGIEEVPQDIKNIFEVSFNISAEEHIRIQAAFQEYTSNAVSKTVNFPKNATVNDVKEGYMLAWKAGCKGCTVYRDGSRENQVLNIKEVNMQENPAPNSNTAATGMPATQQLMMMAAKPGNGSMTRSMSASRLKKMSECPSCDEKLVRQEGCVLCPSCGFSACDT